MANPLDVILHASGTETVSGVGPTIDIEATSAEVRHPRSGVRLALEVTAASGVQVVVSVETSPSPTGAWKQVGTAFRAAGSLAFEERCWGGLRRYARVRWALTGSGSVTFAVTGEAHTLYADPAHVGRTAITEEAIEELGDIVIAEQCFRATADAETAINSSFQLPLTKWGDDLRGHVAARAAFYCLGVRGFDAESAADQIVVMQGGCTVDGGSRSASQRYFDDVAAGKLKPVGIIDATPDEYEGSGVVVSGPSRYGSC